LLGASAAAFFSLMLLLPAHLVLLLPRASVLLLLLLLRSHLVLPLPSLLLPLYGPLLSRCSQLPPGPLLGLSLLLSRCCQLLLGLSPSRCSQPL
jgi:hypothetical protein